MTNIKKVEERAFLVKIILTIILKFTLVIVLLFCILSSSARILYSFEIKDNIITMVENYVSEDGQVISYYKSEINLLYREMIYTHFSLISLFVFTLILVLNMNVFKEVRWEQQQKRYQKEFKEDEDKHL